MARQLGVDPRTARRLLEDKKILRRKDRNGKSEYSLIDSDLVDIPRTCPGRIYPLRKAAAIMGLPISVLKNLKASGDYQHRLHWRIMSALFVLVKGFVIVRPDGQAQK